MIGPCNNTEISDPTIIAYKDDKNFKNLIITINTEALYNATEVCLKFLRNGTTDVMMSEPFQLQII